MFKIILLFYCIVNTYGAPLDSNQKDAPWHIHLDISGLRCGGSLVQDKYVVTAAHCFDAYFEQFGADLSQFDIYIGEWKIGMDPDCDEDDDDECCDNVIKMKAADLRIHEKYDKSSDQKHNYDIAVITLKRPPRISDIVSSVLLTDDECDESLTGKDLKISGFGELRPGVQSVIRKRMEIKVFEHNKCLSAFQNKGYDSHYHMCGAGRNGLSTCKGDSGSGAVIQVTNDEDEDDVKAYLHGIVVFGSDLCGDGKPTALLKISCFSDWINGVINPKSIKKQKSIISVTTTSTSKPNSEEGSEEGY